MVKCKLIFRKLVLDDKVSTAVMKSLLDAIDIFENSGGCTINHEGFLDALVDGINVCRVNNAVQMAYLNWLIYDSIQILGAFNDSSYDDLERVTRKTLTYLMKLIEANPEASKAYVSFDDISSDGELTLILEDHKMSFKGKIDNKSGVVKSDDDEYTDFQLSKYPFIGKVFDDGFYWGAIETIKEIDERMYFKFKSNNMNEVAILALYAGEKPLGAIGISFCGQKQMDASAVGKAIRKCGIQVATLLSN